MAEIKPMIQKTADSIQVVNHLQIIQVWAAVGKEPIYNGIEPKCCENVETWVKDAIELIREQNQRIWELLAENKKLKEQEAVEPILRREGWNKYHNDYVCPRCDNEVFYEQNYCSGCGVRFIWEGGEFVLIKRIKICRDDPGSMRGGRA